MRPNKYLERNRDSSERISLHDADESRAPRACYWRVSRQLCARLTPLLAGMLSMSSRHFYVAAAILEIGSSILSARLQYQARSGEP
jgi:hypothetical protein